MNQAINQVKKCPKELINGSDNESTKVLTKKSTNELTKISTKKSINKSINEPHNINNHINKEVNSNITSWYDIDKSNKMQATIGNNNFNHKNKVGKLKFNDTNDLINSIKSNTISEEDAKKK